MADTSARALRLLSLLQTHRYWPGLELRDRLEVSARTLRRDINRLRELGYPIEARRGVDGGYPLAAGATLPPLVLDNEEAVALAVALQVTAQSTIAGIEEPSLRALAKVVQVMPAGLRQQVDTLRAATVPAGWRAGPAVDVAILTTIARACRDEERLRFRYTARGGEETDRLVEPHRLVPLGNRWYLVAYDLTWHQWRSFRVDRVTDPRNTRASFRPRTLPAPDAASYVRSALGRLAARFTYEALVDAPAAEVRARVGDWGTVEELADGRSDWGARFSAAASGAH